MTRFSTSASDSPFQPPPFFLGRWRIGLLTAIALVIANAGHADGFDVERGDSPYALPSGTNQAAPVYRPGSEGGVRNPSARQGSRNWTGLRVQRGATLSLVFGSDPYHDGATLAAILHGLEVGELLSIERIDAGVLLRRHGRSGGSAYDSLDLGPERE